MDEADINISAGKPPKALGEIDASLRWAEWNIFRSESEVRNRIIVPSFSFVHRYCYDLKAPRWHIINS